MGVVGTVTVGIHSKEIVVVVDIIDPVAAIVVGKPYRLMDYDWDFSIENGSNYCSAMASGVVFLDRKFMRWRRNHLIREKVFQLLK